MPLLQHAFPDFVVKLCESRLGISDAITTLNGMGDNPSAQATYQSYAARLASWRATVPAQPSTETLAPIVPLI